jgi:hypothetical protein
MREDFIASALIAAAVLGGGFLGAALAKHAGHVSTMAQTQSPPVPAVARIVVADGK